MLEMERLGHPLPRAWGLAVVLTSLPWLGVVGGWALDRLLDSFPLLLVIGGLGGVCGRRGALRVLARLVWWGGVGRCGLRRGW